MDRLLQPPSSRTIAPSKPQSRPSPLLPRLHSPSLSFTSSRRLESRRVSSISCFFRQNPSPDSSPGLNQSINFLIPSSQTDGSKPNPGFIQRIVTSFEQRKTISAGMVILVSAVAALLLNPILVPPAFASFQTATNSGGAAVGGKLLRTEVLTSAWTGFFAGCLHTLSGPDHLAALAPLSIGRTRMESAAVGALWGCGHDAGQLIFGLLFLLLKDRLHIEVIRTWGTRVVGLTLLVIGAMGIKEASEIPEPCVVTLENGETDEKSSKKKKIGFATFATGIVHGLQPDALMMVLPALALPSRIAGASFLIMFLIGTVIAMGSYTVFIGSCSEALKEKVPRITEKLTWASSLVAIGLGLAIIVSQFFGFSLY
ncbi:Urease accessory protein UreH-like transmembrane domain [Arabidopsis suecica]|uniref:Urease accessory protein UreH-like transmembrane domain n=1 Tax=Arabidopsis suecica TaxID=45249 RepID=A0A8T2BJT3_ARASU|nr:Urease accessory protein UreH-like transmembrane domain [Arabidopsis suecica]